jgi:hypothetical protein
MNDSVYVKEAHSSQDLKYNSRKGNVKTIKNVFRRWKACLEVAGDTSGFFYKISPVELQGKRDSKLQAFAHFVSIKIPQQRPCSPLPQAGQGVRLYFSATHVWVPLNGLFKSFMSSLLHPRMVYTRSTKISVGCLKFRQELDIFKFHFRFHQLLRANSKLYTQTDHSCFTPYLQFTIHDSHT